MIDIDLLIFDVDGIGRPEDILKVKPDFIIDDLSELKNIIKK